MDSCMTCKEKDNCIDFTHNGNVINPICWQPVDNLNTGPIIPQGEYEILGREIGALVDLKNPAYGDIKRVTEAMKVFYPNGIPVERLGDALLVTRILDKINRISGGNKEAFSENPFKDIAGYGLLGAREGKV